MELANEIGMLKRLLLKRVASVTQGPVDKAGPAAPDQVEDRPTAPRLPTFFEATGDLLSEVTFLRNLGITLGAAVILLTTAVCKLANKPPVVIRVDKLTPPVTITDPRGDAFVTAPEVRNFSEHFTKSFHGWDLFTFEEHQKDFLGMMTSDAGMKMRAHLDEIQAAAKVQADALRSNVVISEIAVVEDSPKTVRVKVRGARVSFSYEKKDFRKETMFEDTITAKKVDRATSPWGLLVEDWSESIYKETQTP